MRILGIDPGSRITGYGLIDSNPISSRRFVSCGVIRPSSELALPDRLKELYDGLGEVIANYNPDCAAIENVFVARNPGSALKLGQARGVLVLAVKHFSLALHEFPAKVVKQAVTGYGQAGKQQIQQVVKMLLQLDRRPGEDASDGLAVAICCANHLVSFNGGWKVQSPGFL
ncbi:MAG: crossover junction endodeoxyribonuclease RuvC [Thermodesulfobacteriota bacterium]